MTGNQKTEKSLMLVLIYVGIALLTLVWRFVSIPWDFGGCFYQIWVAAIGTAFFARLYPRLNRIGRGFSWAVVLPIGAFLLLGSFYVAPQALFPFMFLVFALVGALFLWSKEKVRLAVLVSLLLIPLAAYCSYGVRHIALLYRIRSMPPGEVAELRFTAASGQSSNIVISRPEAITSIVMSLRQIFPYSPNHESIKEAWRLAVFLRDGSRLQFSIGNGNRAHPSFVWIQFGVEVYQNTQLREALQALGVNPWNAEQHKAQQGP